MNYEELLAARNEGQRRKTRQPLGGYYREQVDGKWRGVIDVRPDLRDNMAFTKALEAESEKNKTLANNRQLHFTLRRNDRNDLERLELEPGNYQPFEQLLLDNPAVVAERNFIDYILEGLVDTTTYLHEHAIHHLCYSPSTVLARRGDHAPMLLSHGSFYLTMNDQEAFYGEDAKYVAPEVLAHGAIDDRADVYGIGMFIMALCDKSDIPLEYRAALKKATSQAPEDRYATPVDLLAAVQKRKNSIRSIATFAAALLLALLGVVLYFDMFPESQEVEFVKPAPKQPVDDLLDEGIDPAQLGVTLDGDSLVPDESVLRNYQAKAEEIFRKKYEKEADRILSRIYNKEYMNNSEKRFMTGSESTIEELMNKQAEMGSEAGLSPERSQLIATEIIERITNEKKRQMGGTNSRAVQLPQKK